MRRLMLSEQLRSLIECLGVIWCRARRMPDLSGHKLQIRLEISQNLSFSDSIFENSIGESVVWGCQSIFELLRKNFLIVFSSA